MSDYFTPMTSPGFFAWLVWFDQKLRCHSKTPSCVGDVWLFSHLPFIVSSACPRAFFHRTHPFSQYWLPSLSALAWPSLILSSSHHGGGLLKRPSGLLITTVSLLPSYTWKPKRRQSEPYPGGTVPEVFLDSSPSLEFRILPSEASPAPQTFSYLDTTASVRMAVACWHWEGNTL